MIITMTVIIIPWIDNELGDSTSWQTQPCQLAMFEPLPIMWWKKHSPGSWDTTKALTEAFWSDLPLCVTGSPFQSEARWHRSSSSSMTTDLEDSVQCLGFPTCVIPRIFKQKRENSTKLKIEEGKGATAIYSNPRSCRIWEKICEIVHTKRWKKSAHTHTKII